VRGRKDLREQNRLSWNAAVGAHESHRGDLARYLREGGSTLFPEERELLGGLRDVSLVHLQCGSGGDSLSLAALGAAVTGVDASDEAISAARRLSSASGIPATFVRADIYDWLARAARTEGRRFDAAFASYGVVCWLPDLDAWARGVSGALRPGGRFALVDFHPVAEIFDEDWRVVRDYPAGGGHRLLQEGVGDYVGESGGGLTPAGFSEGVTDFENPEQGHLFRWGLGEVVSALAGAGFRITELREYPYSNGEKGFAGMRELPGRRMVPPEGVPSVPLMYGISAQKSRESR
jgi:SAM-dependent methyltransferase